MVYHKQVMQLGSYVRYIFLQAIIGPNEPWRSFAVDEHSRWVVVFSSLPRPQSMEKSLPGRYATRQNQAKAEAAAPFCSAGSSCC